MDLGGSTFGTVSGAGGVPIAYEEVAGGEARPAVVLVQGLGLPGAVWRPMAAELAGRGFRVVLPDNRGTGRSGKPVPPYSMAQMADDVAAVIREVVGQPALVAGVSLGGMVVQHVALRHPELVRGLVLGATTPGFPTGTMWHPRRLLELLKVAAQGQLGRVGTEDAHRLFAHPENEARAAELFEQWHEALQQTPTAPHGFLGQLSAASRHHTGSVLHRIRAECRVVTGDSDRLVAPSNSRIIAKRIPRARLVVVPRAGHVVYHERSEVLVEALEELHEVSPAAVMP